MLNTDTDGLKLASAVGTAWSQNPNTFNSERYNSIIHVDYQTNRWEAVMWYVHFRWSVSHYYLHMFIHHKDTHTETPSITDCYMLNWPTVRCQGRLSVLYVSILSNHFVSIKKCYVHLLKPNQWNSLFYILNSKLSQGSKHGAMVSTNYPTAQPTAASHKSETQTPHSSSWATATHMGKKQYMWSMESLLYSVT